ncbi:MAG: hypothetical protein HC863_01230 [Myxococcales bacterium]|nr:hypothetical protein [Myxococcales bacterium]
MDVLTDLLRAAGVRRRLLNLRRLTPRSALAFPCEKSMGLHVVTRGAVFLHASALPQPLALRTGDIAVMARGCHHVVSTQAELGGLEIEPCLISARHESLSELVAADDSTVIGGAYQFWNDPIHPFFQQMPAWFVARADSTPRLGALSMTLSILDEEVRKRELGSETIVHALLDVVFTLLLREMVEREGQSGASWSHGVRDPQVRSAVALMHDDCAHPWTLEELAERAGLSRTSLAVRFREVMGDTPAELSALGAHATRNEPAQRDRQAPRPGRDRGRLPRRVQLLQGLQTLCRRCAARVPPPRRS